MKRFLFALALMPVFSNAAESVGRLAFDVKGPVKTVSEGWGNALVVTYNKKGEIVSISDSQGDYMVGTSESSVGFYAVGAGSTNYGVDIPNQRKASESGGEGAYSFSNSYLYNANGDLVAIECIETNEATEEENKQTFNFEVIERDTYGNWTVAKLGDFRKTRKISYFGKNDQDTEQRNVTFFSEDTEDAVLFFNTYGDVVLKGSIGGDPNSEFKLMGTGSSVKMNTGHRFLKIESFNKNNGELVVQAYINTKYIGKYVGKYVNGTYKGIFTNTNGGKVNFNLKK